jgi:transcriptional regulator with XRE-family HTH domain
MVRPPLSPEEHQRGERLGLLLREARGARSMAEIAARSGVPAETLRKIETGRIATPAFFTVAALAAALGLSMEEIVRHCIAQHGIVQHGIVQHSAGRGPETAAALTA